MANWTLNSIRVFVQGFDGDGDQIMAKLQPINSGSIYHTFGYGFLVVALKAKVVGATDMNAIIGLSRTGLSYTLDSPYGTSGDYFVKNVKYSMTQSICQTLRPDLAEDAPVYDVSLELWLDE